MLVKYFDAYLDIVIRLWFIEKERLKKDGFIIGNIKSNPFHTGLYLVRKGMCLDGTSLSCF